MDVENWNPYAFFGVAIAATMVFALVRSYLDRQRQHALETSASGLGLMFRAADDRIALEPFASLPLFERGGGGKFENVASRDGLWVFGYRYTTGHGKNRQTHRQTVTAVRLPGGERSELTDFALQPERWFDRIGPLFGGQDIDFDEDPEFSRTFRLRATDEKATRELFGPTLRRALLDAPDLSIEGRGAWLVIFRQGHRSKPAELGELILRAQSLAAAFDPR